MRLAVPLWIPGADASCVEALRGPVGLDTERRLKPGPAWGLMAEFWGFGASERLKARGMEFSFSVLTPDQLNYSTPAWDSGV